MQNCEEGKEVYDEDGNPLPRGLSVPMGIHSGTPACELEPIARSMDDLRSMVSRCARVSASALAGQIMCSADVVRKINASLLNSGPVPKSQPARAIKEIRQLHTSLLLKSN
ncbi:uncharacterized protein BJ212DRAFT_1511826 [Suillus subaureus]|uniref:Uncharacterized protein n=1 Tax=Suillus subaureus TaxID=48587 RepID=A0A9P7JJY2_9AGAM|nr:uncharacterized protein BJ212DRAFT_1511826 [Suillus subaureus]KAG1826243.1 hypothetical protein BJ212DRAFT_1511826 [Suillus subaureus]